MGRVDKNDEGKVPEQKENDSRRLEISERTEQQQNGQKLF